VAPLAGSFFQLSPNPFGLDSSSCSPDPGGGCGPEKALYTSHNSHTHQAPAAQRRPNIIHSSFILRYRNSISAHSDRARGSSRFYKTPARGHSSRTAAPALNALMKLERAVGNGTPTHPALSKQCRRHQSGSPPSWRPATGSPPHSCTHPHLNHPDQRSKPCPQGNDPIAQQIHQAQRHPGLRQRQSLLIHQPHQRQRHRLSCGKTIVGQLPITMPYPREPQPDEAKQDNKEAQGTK